MASKSGAEKLPLPESDPLWYKDAVIYQLHVRSFFDGDGDGIGDFRGLREKLGYLQDLGVTSLWLLPFYPSPLKDDGYDIADYTQVHPDYGNLQDFRSFLREAHRRGLRVITELVLNHTSDRHPWFQRARRSPEGSSRRNYYVWSRTADRYRGTRIIFKDFEPSNWSWDPLAGAYYWHRFYAHQPDLNFDHPEVRKAMRQVVDFWLGMGVDGLRLDAVPYLFEREGTTCENLPETHAYLRELRRHVDKRFRDRMLLAEANQWPEDAVTYFGQGDECHMAFHFPVMPRLFMGIRMEDRYPILDILQQTPPIPDTSQWALFLRNHDELTLEMVTDEDRDYMYRVYATDPRARVNLGIRRRLAPLLGNDRRQIELMNGLLFSLPGTPVVYYGDEIGMGDNIYLGDRNGVRTPMQWSSDRNAGFSRANAQQLFLPVIIDPEYHYETVNIEAHQNNSNSLLWFLKHVISIRKRSQAFGRGSLEFLFPENRRVLAFLRRLGEERILVVANLSRSVQTVELDLRDLAGWVPVEMFGRTPFPRIRKRPYFFTLGPHGFFWFSLEPGSRRHRGRGPASRDAVPTLEVAGDWQEVLRGRGEPPIGKALPAYLRRSRWFGAKGRELDSIRIVDRVAVPAGDEGAQICLIQVNFREGEPSILVLPLAFSSGPAAEKALQDRPEALVARLRVGARDRAVRDGIVFDPLGEGSFARKLLEAIRKRRRFRGEKGEIAAVPTRTLRGLLGKTADLPEAVPLRAEQSNTSVIYGDRLVLKVYRKVDPGMNPDLEVGLFLTEKTRYTGSPPVAGYLEYRRGRGEAFTLGILQGFVANEGDAWTYTLDALGRFYDRSLASHRAASRPPMPEGSRFPLDHVDGEIPTPAWEVVGTYLAQAGLLGGRTAEMHCALGSDPEDPVFAPEPFPPHYQKSLHQSIRRMCRESLDTLRRNVRRLDGPTRTAAGRILEREDEIMGRFRSLLGQEFHASRIRCHGDYHLGQVLWTGKDFVIIDFEGEPARPIGERRLKRSPLLDIAGMIRSFHYAAIFGLRRNPRLRPEDVQSLLPWARGWYFWVTVAFLQTYLRGMEASRLLPRDREAVRKLLLSFLMEKAMYEIRYEVNSRPEWVGVPLEGLVDLLETAGGELGE